MDNETQITPSAEPADDESEKLYEAVRGTPPQARRLSPARLAAWY
jgi:hypothetical protein